MKVSCGDCKKCPTKDVSATIVGFCQYTLKQPRFFFYLRVIFFSQSKPPWNTRVIRKLFAQRWFQKFSKPPLNRVQQELPLVSKISETNDSCTLLEYGSKVIKRKHIHGHSISGQMVSENSEPIIAHSDQLVSWKCFTTRKI